MEENNRFKYSNFTEVFGELQKVYRVKRSTAEVIFIPAVLLLLVLFGVLTYIGSEDAWTIPFCVVPPVLMFFLVVWQMFSTRRDELRIYENGFTYKSRKNLQSCLWTEVETYTHRERTSREINQLADELFPLDSVEKKNGELIDFDPDLPGTPEIIARVENRCKKRLKDCSNK